MVSENLIQNVSQDRGSCRINSVITGIFAEVLRNAKERIPPEDERWQCCYRSRNRSLLLFSLTYFI